MHIRDKGFHSNTHTQGKPFSSVSNLIKEKHNKLGNIIDHKCRAVIILLKRSFFYDKKALLMHFKMTVFL